MAIPREAGGTEPGIPHYPLVIDGSGIEAESGRRYDTIDPFLGSAWATAADGDAADVDLAVSAARRALAGPWGKLTGFGRARLMRRLGDIIARDADALADIETRDSGKLLREMRGQLASIPGWFYYFAGLADKLQGRPLHRTSRTSSSTRAASRPVSSGRSFHGTLRCCC